MRKLILVVLLFALVPAFGGVAQRTGLWPDKIVFFEEVDQSKVLAMMLTGDAHLFGNAFVAELLPDIKAAGLPYAMSYGSFNTLLLNPAGPLFIDGRFNPFGVLKVRQGITRLIDREYIVEEILFGLGVPRLTMLDPNFPPYASIIETTRALEIKWGHDEAKALALITVGMTYAGADLVVGMWLYGGEPAVLIGLIRVEDERLQIGDYFSNILEDAGFTVDRQYKTSSEASPLWLLDDPANGAWNFYTGGWISNLIDRDQGGDFDFMYTPRGWAVPLNQGFPITPEDTPEIDLVFDRLGRRDYTTVAERLELLAQAETYAVEDCAWNQWIFSAASPWATAKGTSVLVDTAAGVSGAYLWAHTARFVDDDGAPIAGGTMKMASPSMLTQPWNPVAGSNWLYDAMIQRATEAWYLYPDPYTGLYNNNLLVKAEVIAETGLPINVTNDWLTLSFQDEIVVPDDAWADWDATTQTFITVGEVESGRTAKTLTRAEFVPDLFENTWHDGSSFSFADMLLTLIMSFDPSKPESAIYDEATIPAYEQFMKVFKGARIVSTDPVIVEIWHDTFYLDAEGIVFNRTAAFWPYYSQGMAPWHTLGVGILAETAKETAFSEDKADFLAVDRMNFLAGPTLEIMTNHLDLAAAAAYVPYAPTLGQYVTDAVDRYANVSTFLAAYGHLWVGNGPMMVESVDTTAKIVVGKRFEPYRQPADKWLGFAAPKYAEIEVYGPDTLAAGTGAVFFADLTYEGEPYPLDEIVSVQYLLIDGTGNLAGSGTGNVWVDGRVEIVLDAADTVGLVEGSTTLEVVVVLKPVATPSKATYTFIVTQ